MPVLLLQLEADLKRNRINLARSQPPRNALSCGCRRWLLAVHRMPPRSATRALPSSRHPASGVARALVDAALAAGVAMEVETLLALARGITAAATTSPPSTQPPAQVWFSTREAAVHVRQSQASVQRAIQRGSLVAHELGSAARPIRRVHRDDLDEWIRGVNRCRQQADAPRQPLPRMAPTQRAPARPCAPAVAIEPTSEITAIRERLRRRPVRRR